MIPRQQNSVTSGWERHARCDNANAHLFDQLDGSVLMKMGNRADRHPNVQAAKALCRACPVLRECEERRRSSLDIPMVGVWAGRYWSFNDADKARHDAMRKVA